MPELFIGNAAKQHYELNYRPPPPYNMSLRVQRVEIGKQIKISGNHDMETINHIVQQFMPCGIVEAKDVDNLAAGDFVPLVYSIDKPISVAQLSVLMSHNSGVLVVKGKEIRRQAAVASNEQLESNLMETGRPESLRSLEMSVVEENHDDRDSDPAIAEGFRLLRDDRQNAPPGGRRGRRKAA